MIALLFSIGRLDVVEGESISSESVVIEESVEEVVTKVIHCKVTAYCKEPYHHICNNGDIKNTATMTTPMPGRTVAVDPSVIPYGSEVIINEHTYIAEDTGSAIKGNRVDILFETHREALNFGIQYLDVYIKEAK